MVEDVRVQRTALHKIGIILRTTFDFIIFLLLLIPLFCQWIFKQIFKRKKCIKGKTALVTGGGNGLGRALSLSLALHGCNVIVIDIDIDAAENTSCEIIRMGLKSRAYKVDITNPDDIFSLKQEVIKEFGGVDILVNNAGIISATNFGTDIYLETMVRVNLFGPLLITKYFLEHMKERKSGHIVSISSMAGIQPSPYITAYSATKFGITGFMAALNEHLRLERLDDCIKTTCVFPYFIKTRDLVSNFLDSNIRIPPLEVEHAANEIVQAIRREDHTISIPKYLELMKILQCLPISVQQCFNDRVKREYDFKNPNFKGEI